MINLRKHTDWDQILGTLSVSLNPKKTDRDSNLYVLLNGNSGNYCLDYSNSEFDDKMAKRRAWSTDTGYYVKIEKDVVIVTRWWDNFEERIPYKTVQENPVRFYNALIKESPKVTDGIVSFAKEAFIRLRNCIQESDNGRASLRTFMYLLAALEDNIDTAEKVDSKKWELKEFNKNWISSTDWEWVYNAFKKGINQIPPIVNLVLRHASNRLFQEAHREATRKDFQLAMFGGVNRIYDSGISDGAYYTPTALVRTIVQESLWALNKVTPLSDRKSIRVLDPACGSAEFLREILRQLKINNYKGKIEIVGWDISEIAVEMSKFVLNYENITEWKEKININIDKKDSFEYDWSLSNVFDVVLMNPPFQSFENLGERKIIIKKQLGNLIKGQPDMAAVFWKKAAEVTADNGVIGLVMPHSLLGAATYKDLRNYIKKDLNINFSLVTKLGSAGLFEKAMIILSVLVGTKFSSSKANTVLWTDYKQKSVYTSLRELRIYRSKDLPTPTSNENFSIYEDSELTKKDNWTVNSYSVFELSKGLINFTRAGELFKITRGADSGNNAAFVLSKLEFEKLPDKERLYFRACVMRESIDKGQLNDSYYMFYPYGNFLISNENELENKLSQYYIEKLLPNIERLKKRRNKHIKWWELNENRPWQIIPKPKLISAYFGKSGYFAYDKNGDYLVGQSFAWLPKVEKLNTDKYSFSYLAILHSSFIDKLLEMVSVNISGGQFDLSKHYVEKMPLPDLTKSDVDVVNVLSKIGKYIYEGKIYDELNLNQIVAGCYGVSLDILNNQ